jgi:hypothetical protein
MNDFGNIISHPVNFISILCIGMLLIPIFVILSPIFIHKGADKKTLKIILTDQGNRLVLFFAMSGILLLLIAAINATYLVPTGDHFYIMTPTPTY